MIECLSRHVHRQLLTRSTYRSIRPSRRSFQNMATLIRPPGPNANQAPIENVLELTQLSDIDPDLFTNTRPLWHPPGARGIYGGAAIAQCLAAAQRTIPDDFTVHSMHCYFVLAGNSEIPIIYHVEQVRSGKSFATRTVQARQRGKVIFTTTMSFVREDSAGAEKVEHAAKMPAIPQPLEGKDDLDYGGSESGPFQSQRIEILNSMAHSKTVGWRVNHTDLEQMIHQIPKRRRRDSG